MGELGKGRNNNLAENGLLFDSEGNLFDLTEWLKNNTLTVRSDEINQQILVELKQIKAHLAIISGERITDKDIIK
jgi:hypothetical protein